MMAVGERKKVTLVPMARTKATMEKLFHPAVAITAHYSIGTREGGKMKLNGRTGTISNVKQGCFLCLLYGQGNTLTA